MTTSALGRPTTNGDSADVLTWLATERRVNASTQNQALSALLFLHREVLHIEIGQIADVPRARMPVRVPVVVSRDEVARIMKHLDRVTWIMVALLYGASLRLQACLELRVKDLDLERRQIVIRRGNDQKDRPTVLPTAAIEPLDVISRPSSDNTRMISCGGSGPSCCRLRSTGSTRKHRRSGLAIRLSGVSSM